MWKHLLAGAQSSGQLPRSWSSSVRAKKVGLFSPRNKGGLFSPRHKVVWPFRPQRAGVARGAGSGGGGCGVAVATPARWCGARSGVGRREAAAWPLRTGDITFGCLKPNTPTPARWCGARSGVGRGWLWCGRCDPSALVWREEWGRAAGGGGVAVANQGHHFWLLEIDILGCLRPTCLTSAMFGDGPRGEGTCERSSRLPPEAPEGLFELSTEASTKRSKAAGSRPLAG